jgi:transcriptional regulator with XRE-family HTH domain
LRNWPWSFWPGAESIAAVTQTARQTFAANLLGERKRLHFTQEELGFRCDLNVSEISRLERAVRDPRLATIVKLGNALGIPPARLLDGIA